MIILDASAAVPMVAETEQAEAVKRTIAGEQVLVPAHFDAEVLAAISRLLRRRVFGAERAVRAVTLAALLPAERVPLPELLIEAFSLRDRFSSGDSLYAALARRHDATLVTADARFSRAAEGYLRVVVVSG